MGAKVIPVVLQTDGFYDQLYVTMPSVTCSQLITKQDKRAENKMSSSLIHCIYYLRTMIMLFFKFCNNCFQLDITADKLANSALLAKTVHWTDVRCVTRCMCYMT